MPTTITRKFPYPGKLKQQVQTQIFTGHTGIAEYLHRFKLLRSPVCECDADKIESVWHIILEYPRKPSGSHIQHRSMNRKRNEETPPTAPTSAPTQNPRESRKRSYSTARRQRKECYVAQKQQESLGYEQGVALFMNENTERLGIGFGSSWGKSSVSLSPGLANLINGSTSKIL
ncbi:hypothetical protein EVAR_84298_1 [Eumeta japonica]|uniref:Retrotransposon gag domain-containing protein n=1 Tax=Eumeta variegata TaxID=151549 RepID=A0A4C1SQL7_EUMVA|nr:hypothetical protein EVAR_84298_1 [Eumeta japonica]